MNPPATKAQGRPWIKIFLLLVSLSLISLGPANDAFASLANHRLVNSFKYKSTHGYWSTYEFPPKFRINAIHSALLNTGKVLVIAGSGNDAEQFKAGTFRSVVWDPAKGTFHEVFTPSDLFCGGHAFLPDGRLLVIGGTARYEILAPNVVKAAGAMTVKNEDPNGPARIFKKGTHFVGSNGMTYQAVSDFTLNPARKIIVPGGAKVTASQTVVWVEALTAGQDSVVTGPAQYTLDAGLSAQDRHNIYGLAQKITMDKQDYQGLRTTYLFDPRTEKYQRVQDMNFARWYGTAVPETNGKVLAVSGLDQTGQVLPGDTVEEFNPATNTWSRRTDLNHYLPTYPWLYPIGGNRLFYSGSNAGYGPADQGRQPGIWDLGTGTFTPVTGMADQDQLETSGSVMLPPYQNRMVMVMGGGGVGESAKSTRRTAIVDLNSMNPQFMPGPDLLAPTRYPNLVNLPTDTTFVTGGSSDYRGKHSSDNLMSAMYNPRSNRLDEMASQSIGRDYHSEGLLLPDGSVVVMGSNPLFADKADTIAAPFEQRLEIYRPPYFFQGPRPEITGVPAQVHRGQTFSLATSGPAVSSARLMHPGAATHVTDVEQRTVALQLRPTGMGTSQVTVPNDPDTTPDGWYMLFANSAQNVPSKAAWVHVTG